MTVPQVVIRLRFGDLLPANTLDPNPSSAMTAFPGPDISISDSGSTSLGRPTGRAPLSNHGNSTSIWCQHAETAALTTPSPSSPLGTIPIQGIRGS